MQLVVSILLVVIGLALALVFGEGDMRIFGWVVAVAGVLGLVIRAYVARQRDRQRPGRR